MFNIYEYILKRLMLYIFISFIDSNDIRDTEYEPYYYYNKYHQIHTYHVLLSISNIIMVCVYMLTIHYTIIPYNINEKNVYVR